MLVGGVGVYKGGGSMGEAVSYNCPIGVRTLSACAICAKNINMAKIWKNIVNTCEYYKFDLCVPVG